MPEPAETTTTSEPPRDEAPAPAPPPRPRARERGRMRRRLRSQRRMREALLLDLGALVFELHRQGRREPELLQAKAAELNAVDQEVRGLAQALDDDDGILELVAAGIAGSCENCGSLLSTDASYCPACGAAAVPALERGPDEAGAELERGQIAYENAGDETAEATAPPFEDEAPPPEALEQAGAEEPLVEKPPLEEPLAEEPLAEEPLAEDTLTEEPPPEPLEDTPPPVEDEPAAEPAAEKPVPRLPVAPWLADDHEPSEEASVAPWLADDYEPSEEAAPAPAKRQGPLGRLGARGRRGRGD